MNSLPNIDEFDILNFDEIRKIGCTHQDSQQ